EHIVHSTFLPAPCAEWEHVRSRRPGIPRRGHRLRPRWFRGHEIIVFRTIDCEVVEFPWLVLLCHEFPLAIANGPVAFVFPDERLSPLKRVPVQCRAQAGTLKRLDCFS